MYAHFAANTLILTYISFHFSTSHVPDVVQTNSTLHNANLKTLDLLQDLRLFPTATDDKVPEFLSFWCLAFGFLLVLCRELHSAILLLSCWEIPMIRRERTVGNLINL